jgi:hypothetical protein
MNSSCLAVVPRNQLSLSAGFRGRTFLGALGALAALWLASALPVSAQLPYRAGSIITTNFGLQNRLRWTNDTGQVYTPSNTTVRLYDFAGKIVFFCFFDVW